MASDNTYDWVLPEATPSATKMSTTDNNGRVQFQWQLEDAVNWAPGAINVKQTRQNGYENMVAVECFKTNRSVTNQPFTANYEQTTGTIDVNVEADDIVTCEVLNRSNRRDGQVPPTRQNDWWRNHPEAVSQCINENGGSVDLGIFEIRDEAFDDEIDAFRVAKGQVVGDADDVAETGLDLAMGLIISDQTLAFDRTQRNQAKTACVYLARKLFIAQCNHVWMGSPVIDFAAAQNVLADNCSLEGTEAQLNRRTKKMNELGRTLRKYNAAGRDMNLIRDPGTENQNPSYDDPFWGQD